MIIHILYYDDANDKKDCIPESHLFQDYATSWDDAEGKLAVIRRAAENHAKQLEALIPDDSL